MQGEAHPSGLEKRTLVVSYDEKATEVERVSSLEDAINRIGKRRVTWIIISGKPGEEDLTILRERMGLHPVMVGELSEDRLGRPKLIDYRDLILISWKLLKLQELRIKETRVTSLLGKGFLITVVPPGHDYGRTVEKLHNDRDQLRSMGADFLLYDLIDSTVDEYFRVSEQFADLIEQTQDRILENEGRDALLAMQRLRRSINRLRKAIWPLRESVNFLVKGRSDLVDDYTSPYYRDVYDHTIELMDTVDTHRDMLSEMLDLYQSQVSNQLNQIVKVLTIISAIFAPLTFIVGLYGMNFRNMPELTSPLGYPMVLVLMLAIGIAMLLLFRWKRWF